MLSICYHPKRSNLVGELVGETEDHRLGEAASKPVQLQVAEGRVGSRMLLYPSLHNERANGFSALTPDPVGGSRDQAARRLPPIVDRPGDFEEA